MFAASPGDRKRCVCRPIATLCWDWYPATTCSVFSSTCVPACCRAARSSAYRASIRGTFFAPWISIALVSCCNVFYFFVYCELCAERQIRRSACSDTWDICPTSPFQGTSSKAPCGKVEVEVAYSDFSISAHTTNSYTRLSMKSKEHFTHLWTSS